MDTTENLDVPRDEMADSRGPNGEYLFPERRKVTPTGDVVIDENYMKPSLAGEPGLDQPDAPNPTPAIGASGASPEETPVAGEQTDDPLAGGASVDPELPSEVAPDPVTPGSVEGDPGAPASPTDGASGDAPA